jgi:lipopolysaccharide exporter
MGLWALFLVVANLFESTKGHLLKNAHIKFVATAEGEEKSYIASSALVLNICVSFLFAILLFLFADNLSGLLNAGHDLTHVLLWFIPGVAALVLFSHLEAVSQSHLDFKSVFAGYFVRQVLFFCILIYHKLAGIPFTLVNLVIFQSISILVGSIVLFFYTRKYLLWRFNPSTEWMKKIIGFGRYIFGSSVLANIFGSIDQLLIAGMTTRPGYVASYNAASRINAIIDMPSYAAAEVLLPKVSKTSVEEGMGKVKYIYERLVGILLCITLPVSLFIILFPNLVISIIAGKEYQDAALILQLYMVAGILRPVQNQAANMLMSIGKPRLCFIINVLVLVVTFTINYICLKRFDFYGAAIGTVISTLLSMICWYFVMQKQIGAEFGNILKYTVHSYKLAYAQALNVFSKVKGVHA